LGLSVRIESMRSCALVDFASVAMVTSTDVGKADVSVTSHLRLYGRHLAAELLSLLLLELDLPGMSVLSKLVMSSFSESS